MAAKKKATGFVGKVLAFLNKSEKEVQEEQIVKNLRTLEIYEKTQIGLIKNSTIPSLELELEQAQHDLEFAQETRANVALTGLVITPFIPENYHQALSIADEEIDAVKDVIYSLEAKIENAKENLEAYEKRAEERA